MKARNRSHAMDRKGSLAMFVYTCLHVFEDFSRLKALAEPKVVPCGRVTANTLLRQWHVLSVFPVVFLARTWQVIGVLIGLKPVRRLLGDERAGE